MQNATDKNRRTGASKMAILKIRFLLMILICSFVYHGLVLGEENISPHRCARACSSLGKTLLKSTTTQNSEDLFGERIVSTDTENAYFSCVEDHDSCGARGCPLQLFKISLKNSSCHLLGETWGTDFIDVKMSPSRQFIAASVLNNGGFCYTLNYPVVWDLTHGGEIELPFQQELEEKEKKGLTISVEELNWISDQDLEYKININKCGPEEIEIVGKESRKVKVSKPK